MTTEKKGLEGRTREAAKSADLSHSANKEKRQGRPRRLSLLEAALDYARRGWPVFPCSPIDKSPLTPNGFKDASASTAQITAWWTRWPTALIGVPTGERSGVFVVDLDRKPGGSDGVATWKKLVAEHGGAPKTVTNETPSTGRHKLFEHRAGIRNVPLDKLAPGFEIKGEGGYVIMPPSRTADGRVYRPLNGCTEPADAPEWLLGMIAAYAERPRRRPRPGNGAADPSEPIDIERVKAALAVIPSDSYQMWFEIGAALHQSLGEDGFSLFDEWSSKSEKYDQDECTDKWADLEEVTGYTEATIFHHAEECDPDWWRDAPRRPPRKRSAEEINAEFEAAGRLEEPKPIPKRRSLAEVHTTFKKWLGKDFDMDAVDITVAAGASELLSGDPLWVMIIAGPGAGKTETVQSLGGADAHIISTIASEGALLSATARKQRAKNATGGLLCKIGVRGVLVIKDFTSIISMDRNTRGQVLAALREIYDGRWVRNVGTDGGQTLVWEGRIVIVGAVTTAWDAAHAVIASMGDRFVNLRINSYKGREQSGRMAIGNTGRETQMREELADAVGGIVKHACVDETELAKAEIEELLKVANIVTLARTAVERDYQGEVVDSHDPEMPTRFAKQLAQIVRGAVAVGMTRERGMELAMRCARDSIPPLRLACLLDLAKHPGARPFEVRKRINKPWRTVKRELEGLHMLALLTCDEEESGKDSDGKIKRQWRYSLADEFDSETLKEMGGRRQGFFGFKHT